MKELNTLIEMGYTVTFSRNNERPTHEGATVLITITGPNGYQEEYDSTPDEIDGVLNDAIIMAIH